MSWAGNKMATGLRVLDAPRIGRKHHTVSKLRPIVEGISLTTILGNASERKDVVKIHAGVRVDAVDEGLNILVGDLVEGGEQTHDCRRTGRSRELEWWR